MSHLIVVIFKFLFDFSVFFFFAVFYYGAYFTSIWQLPFVYTWTICCCCCWCYYCHALNYNSFWRHCNHYFIRFVFLFLFFCHINCILLLDLIVFSFFFFFCNICHPILFIYFKLCIKLMYTLLLLLLP